MRRGGAEGPGGEVFLSTLNTSARRVTCLERLPLPLSLRNQGEGCGSVAFWAAWRMWEPGVSEEDT